MADHVVDTNVLLVASAAHPSSPFHDTHVPPAEQRTVLEWLVAFRADDARRIVLDQGWGVFKEYRRRLTEQDLGMQIVIEKYQSGRWVPVERDMNGHAIVPEPFARFDRSDRQILACALADPPTITIVNACDSDWLDIEEELAAASITVEHLIEVWLRASRREPR